MKVSALTNRMNDHGTNPRIKVYQHSREFAYLVYEGKPDNADEDVKNSKVESFTVLGKGFLEIHIK